MSIDTLFEQIAPSVRLAGKEGGVTLSGGEALLQLPAALELLVRCKRNGFHTAVETSGLLPIETYRAAAPWVDLWLFGMRVITGKESPWHEAHIDAVLAELSAVSARILPRLPMIPCFFDREDVLDTLIRLLEKYDIKEICLSPWNRHYDLFYKQSGTPLRMPPPAEEVIEICQKRFTHYLKQHLNLKFYENN
jgi:pyruvate formate lyase activating enzyme